MFTRRPGMLRKAKDKKPWEMSLEELHSFSAPTEMQDGSSDPSEAEEMKDEMGTLHDYRHDAHSVKEWLGGWGGNRSHDMSHLGHHVRNNTSFPVYRSTDREDHVYPGAYVTPSHKYADDHGVRNISGDHLFAPTPHKVISTVAHPDELVAVNANEFKYAPRGGIEAWHRGVVSDAHEAGEKVPKSNLKKYGLGKL
jgi:hypothetical protein